MTYAGFGSLAGPDTGGGDYSRNANVNLNANVSGYQSQMSQAAKSTSMVSGAVDTLSSKLDGLSKRAGHKLEIISAGDIALLSGAAAGAVAFQKQLGTLSATAAVTRTSFQGLKSDVENAFTKFPASRGQVVQLVEAISDLGITSTRSIGSLTQTFLKLGAATGEPVQGLATGLIQLSRLMGTTSATQIGNYANSLLTVSKNSGVSATGVLNFAQAIAPMARQAGIGEAAVLGISAAFTKAGADGYVAANTFNSIVQDITNLTQTGSPQLAKYASAIGDTLGQFQKLSGTQQITQLFQTIAKGGPQAINLVNQLGLGTRALSAIQAVSQSGGLTTAINQATGASSNQSNLNKGSGAALNDVVDNLAKIRNQFTQFGTQIGTTFLTPLTKATSLFASWAGLLTAAMKPFAPLIAAAGAVAGVAGAVAGVGLAHIGAIGTIATGRLLLSSNSGPRRALREGRAVGAAQRGGLSDEEAASYNESATRFAAGTLPLRASLPFRYGRYAGQQGGAGIGTRLAGTAVGQRFTGAYRGAEDIEAEGGPSVMSQLGRATLLGPTRAVGWVAHGQTRTMQDSRLSDYERSAYSGVGLGGKVGAFVDSNAENTAAMGSLKALGLSAADATKALGVMSLETGKAGVAAAGSAAKWSLSRLPGAAGTIAGGVGTATGVAARGAGSLLSSATGALFSPLGLAATLIGPSLYSSISHKASASDDLSAGLNPITQYNDQLGIATTKLATFSSNLSTASTGVKGLNGVGSSTPLSVASTVTAQDKVSATGKNTDANIGALAKGPRSGSTAVAGLTSLAQSYDMTDPQQVQLFKENALRAGFDPNTVTAALTSASRGAGAVGATAPINFSSLGAAAAGSEGRRTGTFSFLGGIPGPGKAITTSINPSKTGQTLAGAVATQLQLGYQADQTAGGNAYAGQRQLASGVSYLGGALSGIKSTTGSPSAIKAFGNAAEQFFGGSSQQYQKALSNAVPVGANLSKMSDAQRQQLVLKAIGGTSAGKSYLANLSALGVDVNNPSAFGSAADGLFGKGQTNSNVTQINSVGNLGRLLTTSPTVQKSIDQAGNPLAGLQSQQSLFGAGMGQLGNNTNAVVAAFAKLEGASGDLSQGLGLAAANAESYARQQQSFQIPNQSQEGQLGTAATNYAGSIAAVKAAGPNPPQALTDQQTSDQNAYEGQVNTYTQYLNSMYSQLQQYNVQSERAQQDEQTQMYRSQLAYQIQSAQATQDYNRQVQRTNLSYQIQTTQSQQDYLIQRNRTQRDYDVQLKNEAQTAAQTVYNPFQQIQSQYTIDAASLAYNLQNQNNSLIKQQQELQQAQGLGLSVQSIQELSLADPSNAQQLDSLVQSLMQDPKLAATINTEIAQRLKATTSLTQSQFALQFVQSQVQFQTQLKDTQQDFQTAENRAAQAQALTLSQMAQDFATSQNRTAAAQALAMSQMGQDYSLMVNRAAQDLGTAMTQLYGGFGAAYTRVMSQINSAIKAGTPNLGPILQQLQTAKSLVSGFGATVQQEIDQGVGLAQQANQVVGKAANGQIGYYGSNGQFIRVTNGQEIKEITIGNGGQLPRIYSPITGLAQGGIGTGSQPLTNTWAEAGPEAMIPLNARGEQFMGGMIAKSLANGIVRAGGAAMSSQTTYADYSTNYSGPISVAADDPRAMERQLAARKRVQRLTNPTGSTR